MAAEQRGERHCEAGSHNAAGDAQHLPPCDRGGRVDGALELGKDELQLLVRHDEAAELQVHAQAQEFDVLAGDDHAFGGVHVPAQGCHNSEPGQEFQLADGRVGAGGESVIYVRRQGDACGAQRLKHRGGDLGEYTAGGPVAERENCPDVDCALLVYAHILAELRKEKCVVAGFDVGHRRPTAFGCVVQDVRQGFILERFVLREQVDIPAVEDEAQLACDCPHGYSGGRMQIGGCPSGHHHS